MKPKLTIYIQSNEIDHCGILINPEIVTVPTKEYVLYPHRDFNPAPFDGLTIEEAIEKLMSWSQSK